MDLYLEDEQVALFERLVEASRSVPRGERQPFFHLRWIGGSSVQGNGLNEQVIDEDIQVLRDAGLLRFEGGEAFRIPPQALEIYEQLRTRTKPEAQVEGEITRYIGLDGFNARYPNAYARWSEAAHLLWGAESTQELSTIGHKCREAVQEFVTALIARFGPMDVNPDKAKTRDRFSAVVNYRREALGESKAELLDALFAYWRACGDLIQRQEHAGQREAEPLTWEDGRRAVFQTALLMFEVDRTL